jgi:signal transduction histidine kinase
MLYPISTLVTAPLWILGIVANEPATFISPTAAAQVTIIAILGGLVMAAAMILADRLLVLRDPRGVRAYLIIGAAIVIAAELRLAVIVGGFELAGLPNDVPLVTRALGAALLAVACYVAVGVALRTWNNFARERDRLLQSMHETMERAEGHEVAVASLSAVLRQSIQGQLAQVRSQISKELDSLTSALRAGSDGRRELRRMWAMTDSRWRAISAEAWKGLRPRGTGFREFLWAYSLTRPYSILSVVGGGAALTFFVFVRVFDPERATLSLAIWLVLAFVVALSTNTISRRRPRMALGTLVFSVVLLLSFPLFLVLLGILDADEPELLARTMLVNFEAVGGMIIAGASPAVARNRAAVLDSLRRSRDRASIEQLQLESRLLAVARQLAATLHGPSRATFMAEALRLEAALDKGDREAAIEVVEKLRAQILEAEFSLDRPIERIEPADIELVIDNWRSVCAIDVKGSWRAVPPALLADVHTVVVEGIVDAMRHAVCSHIAITIQPTGTGFELSLTNDGKATPHSATPGLGSALLDHVAPGSWSRETDVQSQTRLRVFFETV